MKLTLKTTFDREKFYAQSLGSFGKPLVDKPTPDSPIRVEFDGKVYESTVSVPPKMRDPFENGFSTARGWAEGCLGWIWWQWLHGTPKEAIRPDVEFVVRRGIEMQEKCPNQHYRGLHDLWLLNCAILASSEEQLKELAAVVVDAKGDKQEPRNNGELFAAAWCGALKYWILGDMKKSAEQFEIAGGAYRYDIVKIAPKPLVAKWLARDWKGFVKEQRKDFKALWEFLRKYKVVISENESKAVIDFNMLPVPGRGWCWSHCGLAMLAYRQGIEVASDAFWFPPHALQCVERGNIKT